MATPRPDPATRRLRLELALDSRQVLLLTVIGLQALWLAVVMLPGWYSGPDLANLQAASGQPLSRHYLGLSLGGHFGAPARLVYWVLERVAPLSWGLTVALRLALQAGATYLLWRLLEELVGRRPWIPAVMALYAVSPMLVPATAVLSNGLGLSVAQTAVLGALLLHVRYTRGGPARQAVAAALLVLLAMSFADQAATVVVLLPALSLGFLHTGSVRQRVGASARRWVSWAALAVAAGAYAVLYLTGSYAGERGRFTPGAAWTAARTEWTEVLGPALLGGPWRWSTKPQEWAAYLSPPLVLEVLGQVALLGLVVLSVRSTGRRALLAWALPVVTAIGGALLVAYGRQDFLDRVGVAVAEVARYSYFVPLALALGLTLAFARTPEEERAAPLRDPAHERRPGPAVARAVPVLLALVGVASLWSGLRFADRFWQNPSRAYVETLASAVERAGPAVELYDSTVPLGVIPALEPNHFVSDVLDLARVRAVFGGDAARPLVVDDKGHLVDSGFYSVADVTSARTPGCGTFVHGAGSTTVTLGPPPRPDTWYLRLELYQPHPNTVTIEVRDADGRVLALHGGARTARPSESLAAIHRRLGLGVPATVTLSSADAATNLCLVHAYLGFPVPKGAS